MTNDREYKLLQIPIVVVNCNTVNKNMFRMSKIHYTQKSKKRKQIKTKQTLQVLYEAQCWDLNHNALYLFLMNNVRCK